MSEPFDGWRRIRTFESVANRFTVCPLWPLGNPSLNRNLLYMKYLNNASTFFGKIEKSFLRSDSAMENRWKNAVYTRKNKVLRRFMQFAY